MEEIIAGQKVAFSTKATTPHFMKGGPGGISFKKSTNMQWLCKAVEPNRYLYFSIAVVKTLTIFCGSRKACGSIKTPVLCFEI